MLHPLDIDSLFGNYWSDHCKASWEEIDPMSTMLAEGDDLSGAEKVFAFFRDALLDGSLKAGERLLGERELSLRLGVSRPLLREALRSLAMLGFLDIRTASGAYVRQADINVLSDFFTFSLAQQPDILDDVMQARIAIECQAIRLACERATESDLKRIGSKLTRLMDTLHDPDRGRRRRLRLSTGDRRGRPQRGADHALRRDRRTVAPKPRPTARR